MLPTKRSAIALARGARTGVLMVGMPAAVKTASKAVVNLASRSRKRNRKRRPVSSLKAHPQVAGLLGQPGAGGMGGDPEDVHPAGGVLDDDERVEPVQRDGVQVEQVAGEDRLWLCAEELRPARSCPPRRGVDAGPVQDGPDGGGADPVAEAGELAVDAAVAPLGFSVARASSPRRRGVGSSRVSALIRARSVQLILGRGVRRRSTASWLRRTRISMSLLVSDRARSTIQPRSVENIWQISRSATGGSCRPFVGCEAAGQRVEPSFGHRQVQGFKVQVQPSPLPHRDRRPTRQPRHQPRRALQLVAGCSGVTRALLSLRQGDTDDARRQR